jgi:GT2 family glycosyltransferase/glycosyltransferase involved in cell wall biosynthesis
LEETLEKELQVLFDQDWYLERYPDVRASGMDPLEHYIRFGVNEGRDPNRFFDRAWHLEHYPEVAASQLDPLVHYLRIGARELRNPHPRFGAAWYTEQHLEAAANPLVYHQLFGRQRGWSTERPIRIADYLPSGEAPPSCPEGVVVDVVIPVYRGLAETRRCIESVLADTERPAGRIIVIDDRSPESELSAWLNQLKTSGHILLIRNSRNLGFVASANVGMQAAGNHDVILLNSDTDVPVGWLARLAGHAYALPSIASVSPFSNNATICGYPSITGGPSAFDLPVSVLDQACRTANGGRHILIPTTVGFCMYIRCAALNDVGLFDAAAFGRGYGEENDFCLRATARGWRHLLACDTFVYHAGKTSFGTAADERSEAGQKVLVARWPNYRRMIEAHIREDQAASARFTMTAALFRHFARPVILLVSHRLGGGVDRHIAELVKIAGKDANFLLLEATPRGIALSFPALDGHSVTTFPAEGINDIATLLRSAGVSRVHIHHIMGIDLDLRRLVLRLGVPFDLTVHDYYLLCPQVNLLPWLDGHYCGEPQPAACNACINERPSHGARDITLWRAQHRWLFLEAERVFCPSEDVCNRLARHDLATRAIVAPHEPVPGKPWPQSPPRITRGQKLHIALIGVLAAQKGAATVATVIEAADPSAFEFRLIGHTENELPARIRRQLRATGKYDEQELPNLLAKIDPDAIWFPAQWPETYSYTLSAAINAGRPIVASNIGAFPERLKGRPLTWLVEPNAPASQWINAFADVRTALTARTQVNAERRRSQPDFYAIDYLQPKPVRKPGPLDLRQERTRVLLIPERFSDGSLTPCAYIRLLQPLDHLAATEKVDLVIADAEEALHYLPHVIITQRHAVSDVEHSELLLRYCRDNKIPLIYDLDDDLLDIPRNHPDAQRLRPLARSVERMLRGAEMAWVTTPALRQRVAKLRNNIRLMPNALDERLWADPPARRHGRGGPVRMLFMGTLTHDEDFAVVQDALARLHSDFPGRFTFDMIGVSNRSDLPDWVNRVPLAINANLSYPGFVNWLISQPGWDVGIAPLADTAFNAAKSAIKAMDYAALGLAAVASDVAAYAEALPGHWRVKNTEPAWYEALSRLVRDAALRHSMAAEAQHLFGTQWSLAAQQELRHTALKEALARTRRQPLPAEMRNGRRGSVANRLRGRTNGLVG